MIQNIIRKSKSSQLNLRNKGKRHASGKIIKGCVQDASTKLSIGCIPANYQSIIYRSNNQTAFGTSSIRFNQNTQYFNVAPGQYNKQDSLLFRWKSQQNFNKKGYGPFISKQKRGFNITKNTPGPGNYEIRTQFKKKSQLETTCTTQGRNIFTAGQVRFKQNKDLTPGPGDYDPKQIDKHLGWKSCFKSQVDKCNYINQNQNPGPGQYNLFQQNKKLKSKTKKELEKKELNLNEVIQKVMQYRKQNFDQISYEIPDFLPKYQKIKNSPIFMPNMKDRFGNFNKEFQNLRELVQQKKPGPCQYQIKSTFEKQHKSNIGGVGFISQTIRNPFKNNENILGPNTKQVFKLGKKVFHLNLQKKWI